MPVETQTDTLNVSTSDPNDFIFVSKKNWVRKRNVQDGNTDQLTKLVGRPGPITGIILSILDAITTFLLKIIVMLLQIANIGFDWVMNSIFGNFSAIIPNEAKKGKVVSLKWFRYAMTIMMPPFGVFLSKGIYGWFNILVCTVLTYLHFLIGIIYAFVITMRNRYADQYEDNAARDALSKNPNINSDADINALIGSICFSAILIGFIMLMMYYL
jgi:uncharacterized membrane protein YqaE (UPF0057 family)